MARVFWDTNLFIYLFENNPEWTPHIVEFRQKMLARRDDLLTSWLTVGEVLTKPKQLKNTILEKSYLQFFSGTALKVIAFDLPAAQRYAEIRSRDRIRPADAIQLACASAAQVDLFVTNDHRFSGLVIPGITFVTTLARIPY